MHLERVSHATDVNAEVTLQSQVETPEAEVLKGATESLAAVQSAIDHERKTAEFYRELSKTTAVASLRGVFASLADEEDSHVAHLEEYLASGRVNV